MANNQATQEESEWTNNKEMNIQENSATTDSVNDEEPQIQSTWRASEGENAVKPTEFSTGGAGKSSAEQTDRPNNSENKD